MTRGTAPAPSAHADGYALFDTPLGRCGIAWTGRGIAAVQLPEPTEEGTRASLQARLPHAAEVVPPPPVRATIDRIVALLAGRMVDLDDVVLDMGGVTPFHQRVYQAARAIPAGATTTYGALAEQIGEPGAARAIGQALGRNPFAVVVPCHRVLAADGRVGGFSASGGVGTKLAILAAEGTPPPAVSPPAGRRQRPPLDPATAVAHLRQADAAFGPVIAAAGPVALETKRTGSVFAGLAEAIVYQQLSGRAAATIFGRVLALRGATDRDIAPEQILGATDADLRGAGLSRPKILALRDLADRTAAGALPTLAALRAMPDENVIDRLTEVRGIGRWSAQMFLIFRLGRPDVLPAADLGVRKGFATVFGGPMPPPEDVLLRGERWKPFRTAATWYLWRAVDGGL